MSSIREWLNRIQGKSAAGRTELTKAARRQRKRDSIEYPRLYNTHLEERRVLDAMAMATLSDLGVLTIQAGSGANDGVADSFHVSQASSEHGTRIEIRVNDELAWSGSSDEVQSIELQGSDDVDQLVFQSDAQTFQSINYQLGESSGAATFVTTEGAGTLFHFEQMEQITDANLVADRSFTVDSTVQHVQWSDAGTESTLNRLTIDGEMLLNFSSPSSALEFQSVQTGSLTVSPSAQTILWNELDHSFAADVFIRGDAADTITVTGQQTIYNHRIDLSAGTIDILGSMDVGSEGMIRLDGGEQGTVTVTGSLLAGGQASGEQAAGGQGGTIHIFGDNIEIRDQAVINVSGLHGGGEVLIGGGREGALVSLQNASTVYVGAQVTMLADALEVGDGGTIIIWSEEVSRVEGSGNLKARGGAIQGNGGFIETSSRGQLWIEGAADASAPHGEAGTWSLDPFNITIGTAGVNLPSANFTSSTDNTLILATSVNAALNAGTSVTLITGAGGVAEAGNITVASAISLTTNVNVTFRLEAVNNIVVNANITATNGTLNVYLQAGNTVTLNNASITTSGGTFTADSATLANTVNSTIDTDGGAILIDGSVSISNTRTLTLDSSNGANGGNVTILGNIDGDGGANENLAIVAGDGAVQLGTNAANQIGTVALRFGEILVTSAGDVTVNGTVAADSIHMTSSGLVLFISTLNLNGIASTSAGDTLRVTAQDITINNGSGITFSGTAEDIDLRGTGGGTVKILQGPISLVSTPSAFSIDANFTQVQLRGGISTSGQAITITPSLLLTSDVVLDTTNGSATGAAVTLGNTVDATAGNHDLTVRSGTSAITITGNIAGAVGLASNVGNVNLNGGVVATSRINATGNITLRGSTSVNVAGGIDTHGNDLSVQSNSITLGANAVSTGGGGQAKLFGLTTNTTIGVGTGAAGTLNLSTTTLGRIQSSFDTLVIGDNNTATGKISVATLGSPLSINTGLELSGSSTNGLVEFFEDVTLTKLNASLVVTAADSTVSQNVILKTLSGDIQFDGSIALTNGRTLTLNSTNGANGGDITLRGNLDGNGGANEHLTVIGGNGNLTLGTTTANRIGTTALRFGEILVSSVGNMTVHSAVVADSIHVSSTAAVVVNSTLDLNGIASSSAGDTLRINARDITIANGSGITLTGTAGDIDLRGTAGGTVRIQQGPISIVNTNSAFEIDANFVQVQLHGGVSTSGEIISIDSSLLLMSDVVLDTITGSANGAAVTVDDTINATAGNHDLTIRSNTSAITITGNIGGTVGNATNVGNVNLNGGLVTTEVINAAGDITLRGSTAVTVNAGIDTHGNDLSIQSNTIDLAANAISTGGGGTVKLFGLTTATSIGVGTGAVGTLNLDTTLLGRIQSSFNTLIIGDNNTNTGKISVATAGTPLTINTALELNGSGTNGLVEFFDDVTISKANASLVVTAATTTLSQDVRLKTTNGEILIQGSVTMTSGRTLTLESSNGVTGGDITIRGNIDGDGGADEHLTVLASTGEVILGTTTANRIGTTGQRFGEIRVVAAGDTTVHGAVVADSININSTAAVQLNSTINLNGVASSSAGNSLRVNARDITIANGSGITLSGTAEDIDLRGTAGGTIKIQQGPISITGTDSAFLIDANFAQVQLHGGVSTGGEIISIASSLMLMNDVVLDTTTGSATGAAVTLSNTINATTGNHDLTIRSNTSAISITGNIAGAVGTASNVGNVNLNGGVVTTNGINATGNITLRGSTSVTVNGGMDTHGNDLSVQSNSISLLADAISTGGGGEAKLFGLTTGTSIGVGSGAVGTLSLSNATLGRIQSSFDTLIVGDNNTTAGKISVGTAGNLLAINTGLVVLGSATNGLVELFADVLITKPDAALQIVSASILVNQDVTLQTDGGDISIANTVQLGANRTLSLNSLHSGAGTDGDIHFLSNVSGATTSGLNITAGTGTVNLGIAAQNIGTVGTPLANINVVSSGALNVVAALQANTIDLNSTGIVTQNAAINSQGTLSVTGSQINLNRAISTFGVTTLTATNSITTGASGTIDTHGSDLFFAANAIQLNANVSSTGGGGEVHFNGATTATPIGLGTGAAGTLVLNNNTLSRVQSTFDRIVVGAGNSALGKISVGTVGTAVAVNTSVFLSASLGDGAVDFQNNLTVTKAGGSILVEAADITVLRNATLKTDGGEINLTGVTGIATGQTLTLDSRRAGAGPDGNVIFNGAVSGSPTSNLTILADTGIVDLGILNFHSIGQTPNPLGNVTVVSSGQINIPSSIAATNVSLTSTGDILQNGAIEANGTVALEGVNLSINDSINAHGDIKLLGSTSIVSSASGTIDSNGNDVLVQSNAISLNANIDSTGGGGTVTFGGTTGATSIGVGDNAAGTLQLLQSTLDRVQSGFVDLSIGLGATQTGIINVDNLNAPFVFSNTGVTFAVAPTVGVVNLFDSIRITKAGGPFGVTGAGSTTNILNSTNIETNGGVIDFQSKVFLQNASTLELNSRVLGGNGNLITFGDEILSDGGGDEHLTIFAGIQDVTLGNTTAASIGTLATRFGDINIAEARNVTINASIVAESLNVVASGDVTFNSPLHFNGGITAKPFASLSVQGTNITFANAADFQLSAGGGNIELIGNGGGTVTLGTGAIDLSNVGFASFSVDQNFNTLMLGNDIRTRSGLVQILTDVQLTQNVTVDTNVGGVGGGNIEFSNLESLNGNQSLTLNAGPNGMIQMQKLGSATNKLRGFVVSDAARFFSQEIHSTLGVDVTAQTAFITGTIDSSGGAVRLTALSTTTDPALRLSGIDSHGQSIELTASQQIILEGGNQSVFSSAPGAVLLIHGNLPSTQMILGGSGTGGNGILSMSDTSIAAIGSGFTDGIFFGSTGQTGNILVQGAAQSFANAITYRVDGGADLTVNTNVDTVNGGATGQSIRVLGNNLTLINLRANLTTDGGDVVFTSGQLNVLGLGSPTIDTGGGLQQATTGGKVDLSGLRTITGDFVGSSLNIDTRGSTNGGDVLLGDIGVGGLPLDRITVNASGATRGKLFLNDNDGATSETVVDTYSGIDFSQVDLVLSDTTRLSTGTDGGTIKLGNVSVTGGGQNLTISSATGIEVGNVNVQAGTLNFFVDTNNSSASAQFLATGAVQSSSLLLRGNSANQNAAIFSSTLQTSVGDINLERLSSLTFNGDVTSAARLNLTSIPGLMQLGSNVDLLFHGSLILNSGPSSISLTGANGTANSIFAQGDASLLDLPTIIGLNPDVDLTLRSDFSITTDSIQLGPAGQLNIRADQDNDTSGAELNVGNLLAGSIDLGGGTDHNDLLTTTSGLFSFTSDIRLHDFQRLTTNSSHTSTGRFLIENIGSVELGGGATLTAGGVIEAFNGVSTIRLVGSSGALNFIQSSSEGTAIRLANIVADQSNVSLNISSNGSIELANVNLQPQGVLTLGVDTNANSLGDSLSVNTVTVGALVVNGGSDRNDVANFTGPVTTSSAGVSIANFSRIEFDSNVTAANGIVMNDITNQVALGANVVVRANNGDILMGTNVAQILLLGGGVSSNAILANQGSITLSPVVEEIPVSTLSVRGANGVNLASVTIQNDLSVAGDNDQNGVGQINASGILKAGNIVLQASSGIGHNSQIVIDTLQVTAVNRASNSLRIDNVATGNVRVELLENTGNGSIRFRHLAAGNTIFPNVVTHPDNTPSLGEANIVLMSLLGNLQVTESGVVAGGLGTITLLTTLGGNVIMDAPVTATGDLVQVFSAGNITGTGTLSGGRAELSAATGIGAPTIDLAVSDITATTVAGNIGLINQSATTALLRNLQADAGHVSFAQLGGGEVLVSQVTAHQNVEIINDAGDVTVAGQILSKGSGGIDLSSMNNINLFIGSLMESQHPTAKIRADAFGNINMQQGAILRVGTANPATQATVAGPRPLVNVLGLQLSPGANISSNNEATLNIGLGTPFDFEENFLIRINWSDGNIDTYPPEVDDFNRSQFFSQGVFGDYQFSHSYLFNPGPDATSPIPFTVTVKADMLDRLEFVSHNGTNTDFFVTEVSGLFTVPGVGIGTLALTQPGAIPIPEIPVIVETTTYTVIRTTDSLNQQAFETTTLAGEASNEDVKKFVLRIVFPGTGESDDIPLPENVLSNLNALFESLEDDRYRIYLIREDGLEQLVKDFYLRNHVPAELEDDLGTVTDGPIEPAKVSDHAPNESERGVSAPVERPLDTTRIDPPEDMGGLRSFRKAARALRRSAT